MKRIICNAVLLFCTVYTMLFAGDFSNTGHFETGVSVNNDSISGYVSAYLDQKLEYDDGAFVVRQGLEYLPQSEKDVAAGIGSKLDYTLFQGYLELSPKPGLTLTAGKFRLPWTRSIFFAPLDKLNPGLQGLDVKSPREGFWGAALGWSLNQDIHVSVCTDASDAVVDPESFDIPAFGIGASWFSGNLDLFVSTIYKPELTGVSGAAASIQLFDTILYAETGIEWLQEYLYPGPLGFEKNESDRYLLGDVGLIASAGAEKIIYFTNSTLSLIAEYQFTECGYKKDELIPALTLLYGGNTTEGTIPFLGQHHAFGSVGIELTDLLSFDNSILCNVADASFLQMHSLVISYFPDIDVKTTLEIYQGSDTSEFGQAPSDYSIHVSALFHF